MNNTDTPTPRTDAFNRAENSDCFAGSYNKTLDFARSLERELAEQTASHAQTVGIVSDAFRERDEAKRELEALRARYVRASDLNSFAHVRLTEAGQPDHEGAEETYRSLDIPERIDRLAAELSATREHCRVLKDSLQQIADESQKHHEFNPVSGKSLLPQGYTKIMNLASDAIATTPEQIGAEIAELREDKARVDWQEGNPHIHFAFRAPLAGWHNDLKTKFPLGFWKRVFARDVDAERFRTKREAIDAARKATQ